VKCVLGASQTKRFLTEWREMCRQKGISVDEEGKETVPDQLRLHYKKSQPENGEAEPGSQAIAASQTTVSETATISSNTAPATQVTTGSESHVGVCSQNHEYTAASTSDPSSTVSQRPTPTLTHQPRGAAVQSFHGPWLDRAIFGVVIALVLMILRKMTNSELI